MKPIKFRARVKRDWYSNVKKGDWMYFGYPHDSKQKVHKLAYFERLVDQGVVDPETREDVHNLNLTNKVRRRND